MQHESKTNDVGLSSYYQTICEVKQHAYDQEIEKDIISQLKKKHKIKKLTDSQLSIGSEILNIIMANEEVDNWKNSVENYCNNPIDKNQERVNKVLSIAAEHQVDTYMAALLYASKK